MEESSSSSKYLPVGVVVIAVCLYLYAYGMPDLGRYSTNTLMFAGAGLIIGLIAIYMGITDPVSLYLFILISTIVVFVVYYFGFVKWNFDKNTLEINFFQRPAPMPSDPLKPVTTNISPNFANLGSSEVFYVANNIFSYDQAPAVCAAYGGELATYSQVEQAYNSGGEWCGYGWTQGGLALFPTQQASWQKLQSESDPAKRQSCGRPGINGGYFDPSMKFGVNCYGKKPGKPANQAANAIDKAFSDLVNKYKEKIKSFTVAPFESKKWNATYANSALTNIKGANLNIGGLNLGLGQSNIVNSETFIPGVSAAGVEGSDVECDPVVNPYLSLRNTKNLALRGEQPANARPAL